MRASSAARLALALVAVDVLAGCATPLPVPEPDAVPAVAPAALGEGQVARVLEDVAATVAAGDTALDAEALTARVDGPARGIRTAQYVLAAAGATGAVTALPAEAQTVITSTADEWPRVMMTVTQAPEDLRAPLLETLVQTSPREPYRLWSWARLFPGAQVPATLQPGLGSAPVAADSDAVLVPPGEVLSRYTDVLTQGVASPYAAQFTEDPLRTRIAQQRDGWVAAVGAQGSVTETYTPGDAVYALATADGGAIVVGTVTTVTTLTLVDSTLTIGDQTAALLGTNTVSSSLAITWTSVVAFAVPPAGSADPITVLGAEHQPVSVTGS
jgi:hypothetical protein